MEKMIRGRKLMEKTLKETVIQFKVFNEKGEELYTDEVRAFKGTVNMARAMRLAKAKVSSKTENEDFSGEYQIIIIGLFEKETKYTLPVDEFVKAAIAWKVKESSIQAADSIVNEENK